MTPQDQFDIYREDFIQKIDVHTKLIKEITYEQLSEVGMKGKLAEARFECTISYAKFVHFISQIKVNINKQNSLPPPQNQIKDFNSSSGDGIN